MGGEAPHAEIISDWQRIASAKARTCNATLLTNGVVLGHFAGEGVGGVAQDHVFDHVFVHGDLHGDIQLFFEFIQLCGLATCDKTQYKKPAIKWNPVARNVAVILPGDIVDRFRPYASSSNVHGVISSVGEAAFEEKYLERAINDLAEQADNHGSIVIKLFGNHEFITREEPIDGPYSSTGPVYYMSPFLRKEYEQTYPGRSALQARISEFQPGGIMNFEIAQCNPAIIFQLNQHMFVHGGISLQSIQYANLHNRHIAEFANSLARDKWAGTISPENDRHFYELVSKSQTEEGSLLWDRTFSEKKGPPSYPEMADYITAVFVMLNEHNDRFKVPKVKGIIVAHSFPGSSVSPESNKYHFVSRKNGSGKHGGYVLFADTNASRSFMYAGDDAYQREPNPRYRVRPLYINADSTPHIVYNTKTKPATRPVPL
jgi:hypothetical protein